MKTLIIFILIASSCMAHAQKKEKKVKCDDYVEISQEGSRIKTDRIMLRNYSKFKLRMTMIVRDSIPILHFESLCMVDFGGSLDLSTDIRISFIFSDGSEELISFEKEQRKEGIEYPHEIFSNEFIASKELFVKMSVGQIDSIKVENPFGKVNRFKTVVDDFPSSIDKKLKNYPTCFVAKLEEIGLLDNLKE